MPLIHSPPFAKCRRAAETIGRQAARFGCLWELEQAATGTAYLTIHHAAWCECEEEGCHGTCGDGFLVRVSAHEANEARYQFRVNRRPDLDVEVGFQAAAVERIARKLGVDPASVSYLKAHATRERKAQEARAAQETRQQADREAVLADMATRRQTASAADLDKATHYGGLVGKARKNYRKRHAAALRRAGAMA